MSQRSRLLPLILVAAAVVGGEAVDLQAVVFPETTPVQGGVEFSLDMGTRRSNWNKAVWKRIAFETPCDWSSAPGLRLSVGTTAPRSDAGVYLALQEADGSWHYHAWACDLTQTDNVASVRFEDFRPCSWVSPHVLGMPRDFLDENQVFDADAITGLAIGCINPLGVGTVTFTLRGIELLPAEVQRQQPVTVVVTGAFLDVNGTTTVPAGLFGHFPGGGTSAMRMGSHREIFRSYLNGGADGKLALHQQMEEPGMAVLLDVMGGDRYATSMRLTNGKWQQACRRHGLVKGRRWAQYRTLQDERPELPDVIFEWWNEPYLNWSNRSRKNFDTKNFDISRAVEGGPVHSKHDGQVLPYLRWTKDYETPPWQWTTRERWRAAKDDKGRRVRRTHPPESVEDGKTFTATTTRTVRDPESGKKIEQEATVTYTAFTPWYVYDVTQFTFWSGKSQLTMYNEPCLAFARGLHTTAPDAPLVVGWDFRCSEDHWDAFRMLYKPTIDACIEHIVGVTDHDYGGDVLRMPAVYEFVTAYGQAYHDKWLYSYNTECGENSDPSAMPAANASMQQAGKRWLKTMWSARKIMCTLATVPDKARSFTFHWFDQGAEGVTFTALRNLRGKLLHVRNADPDLFVCAAVDGTDPRQPRPDFMDPGKELVVAIFNDGASGRAVELPITAPAGCTFADGMVRWPVADASGGRVALREAELAATGESCTWKGTVPSKSLVVVSLKLTGDPDQAPVVAQRQYFANDVLQTVRPGMESRVRSKKKAPVKPGRRLVVTIPETERAGARTSKLRCVFERLADNEGSVFINDRKFALPRCPTPENVCWIREVAIPVDLLQDVNELRFVAKDGTAGYHLVMASVVIEHAAR